MRLTHGRSESVARPPRRVLRLHLRGGRGVGCRLRRAFVRDAAPLLLRDGRRDRGLSPRFRPAGPPLRPPAEDVRRTRRAPRLPPGYQEDVVAPSLATLVAAADLVAIVNVVGGARHLDPRDPSADANCPGSADVRCVLSSLSFRGRSRQRGPVAVAEQVAEQVAVFGGSQASGAWTMPSPQRGSVRQSDAHLP